MTILFVDLAQACAPMMAAETLAAVVSVESGFAPLAIRINSTVPLPAQPTTKAEAIEIATTLVAEGHNVDLGLGGINAYELRGLGLSVSDLFDPCINLKATATLLDGYYRVAIRAGSSSNEAEKTMLQSYYGQGDAEVGAIVGYDRRITDEKKQVAVKLPAVTLREGRAGELPARESTRTGTGETTAAIPSNDVARPAAKAATPADTAGTPRSWDVFGHGRQSSVLVFPHQNKE